MSMPFEYIDASEETGKSFGNTKGKMYVVASSTGGYRVYTISSVVLNDDVWCLADLSAGICTILQGQETVSAALRRLGATEAAGSLDALCGKVAKAALQLHGGSSVFMDGDGDE